MTVAEQLQRCLADPDWLPFRLDLAGDRLLMVRLSPETVTSSAFLDERILTPATQGFWVGLQDFAKVDAPPPTAQALFHVGHCGSTLLSRLIGEMAGIRALREPLPLRELAGALAKGRNEQTDQWLRIIWGWLSRPETRRVHVKLTSACACLLPWYLKAVGPAAALYVNLETYLTSASRGGGAGADVLGFAQQREDEWMSLCPGAPMPTQPAELAARGWLLNMHYFIIAHTECPANTKLVRFEDWLSNVDPSMLDLAAHYQWPEPTQPLSRHPLLQRYAKQTDVTYDATARAADLALARNRFGAFVDEGMTWASKQRQLPTYDLLQPYFS